MSSWVFPIKGPPIIVMRQLRINQSNYPVYFRPAFCDPVSRILTTTSSTVTTTVSYTEVASEAASIADAAEAALSTSCATALETRHRSYSACRSATAVERLHGTPPPCCTPVGKPPPAARSLGRAPWAGTPWAPAKPPPDILPCIPLPPKGMYNG